jgi:hypothetical protein
MDESTDQSIVILLPVFDDWESVGRLVPMLDFHLLTAGRKARVLLVDDGSTIDPPTLIQEPLEAIDSVEILHLRRNVGHQRAIAIGLYYIHEFASAQAVVVMDADGEDRPCDVPVLLAEFERSDRREIVFASRVKRMESVTFRAFYHLYRGAHRVLTGISVRVGNFSVIPAPALDRLMVVSEVWNHYAAAVFKAKLPHRSLPIQRGQRLAGRSKMNFASLLVHGLSAISVFSEIVGARLLTASALFAAGGLILAPFAPAFIGGLLLVVALQAVTFALLYCFLIVSTRSSTSFLLARDAVYYIMRKSVCSNASFSLRVLSTAVAANKNDSNSTQIVSTL